MQVTKARSSDVGIAFIIPVRTDMASDRGGPLAMKMMSNAQHQLPLNATMKDLPPVADGLDACAVPEPSVLEEEAATEELPAAADNSAKPIDGGLERNTVYTFFCWVGSSISSVYYPRA